MSNRKRPWSGRMPTDPRRAGGDIAGPGGPHDRDGVVLDTGSAVLLDYCEVATLALGRYTHDGAEAEVDIGMVLAGRINKTQDQARVLFLFDTAGAAAIISELMAVATRHGDTFARDLNARVEKLLAEGNLRFPSRED